MSPILWMLILTFLLSKGNPICDRVIVQSNYPQSGIEYFSYDISEAMASCDSSNFLYTLDFGFVDVPDRFELLIEGESKFVSDWIGNEQYLNDSLVLSGYIEYNIFEGGYSIDFPQFPPIDFAPLGPPSASVGFSRALFHTNHPSPELRVYPNPQQYSLFKFYIHCDNVIETIDTLHVEVCAPTMDEKVGAENCDSVYINYINRGESTPKYDTTYVLNLSETVVDTVFDKNEHGCIVPVYILVRIPEEVDAFVPNIFSPNGDGNNDVFEIRHPDVSIDYTVYSRWGEVVYEGTGTWDGGGYPSGVYVVVFHIRGKTYITDLTLVR